jgi:hypothetical protein
MIVRQLLGATQEADPSTVKVPLFRSRAQEDLIMATFEAMQQDPLAVPDQRGARDGVKKNVWVAVLHHKQVFSSRATFDKAWVRLRKDGRIGTLDRSG